MQDSHTAGTVWKPKVRNKKQAQRHGKCLAGGKLELEEKPVTKKLRIWKVTDLKSVLEIAKSCWVSAVLRFEAGSPGAPSCTSWRLKTWALAVLTLTYLWETPASRSLPHCEPLPDCPLCSSGSFVHVEAVQCCNCRCCCAPKRSQFWAAVVWGPSDLHTGRRCPPGFTCWLGDCCFVHSFLFLDTGFLFILNV